MPPSDSPKEKMDNILPEWHEPFPKPQTIPSGWDMTGLQAGATETSTVEAESDSED